MTLALHRHGPAEGLPLVLVHAFSFDGRMYDPLLAHLADIPVIVVDLPGYGASPSSEAVADELGVSATPSLDTYADAVVGSLREAGVERAVVAGVSMGGYTALAIAERYPEFLAGIGLLDTAAEADSPEARDRRLTFADALERGETDGTDFMDTLHGNLLAEHTRETEPELTALVRRWLAEAPHEAVVWSQRAMAARPDRTEVLRGLPAPGLVVWGAEEVISPRASADVMADALGTHVVVIADAGHFAAVERPAEVGEALRELCARAR